MTRRAAVLLFLFCLTTAFVLTHLPGGSVPKISWTDLIPGADKVVHAGLYFWLAVFLANCLRFRLRSNRVIVVATMTILAGYAAFDEWSQQFSPHRSPDFYDFVADMIGAWCGVCAFVVFRWIRRRRRQTEMLPAETVQTNETMDWEVEQEPATRPVNPTVEPRVVKVHVSA